MADLRALNVDVTEEAYQGWTDWADANGVTKSALAEAIGLVLPAGLPRQVEAELVDIARQVSAERRARRYRP